MQIFLQSASQFSIRKIRLNKKETFSTGEKKSLQKIRPISFNNYQLSTINYQLSIINYQLVPLNHKAFHKLRCIISFAEIVMAHELLMKGDGGFYAFNYEFAQGTLHGVDGFFSCLRYGDQLGDHAVVVGRDGIAGVDM